MESEIRICAIPPRNQMLRAICEPYDGRTHPVCGVLIFHSAKELTATVVHRARAVNEHTLSERKRRTPGIKEKAAGIPACCGNVSFHLGSVHHRGVGRELWERPGRVADRVALKH